MSSLKLRAKVNFPATVTATGGFKVVKQSGIWTVSPDWTQLDLVTSLASPESKQLWALDPATNTYVRLSVQSLIDNLPDGPTGAAATIAAGTATASNAGSNPTVTNSGTSSAAVFNFTQPRGADAGLRYSFDTSTTMGSPASGGVRLNNSTIASVTAMAVNASEAGGVDVSDFVATWDDSTNTVKGFVEIRKEGSGAVLALFQISSVTDNSTWLQLSLTFVSGSGSFTASDPVYLVPYRVGNAGTNGTVAVSGTPTVNQFAAWVDSTTVKGVSISGLVKGNGASAPTAATAGTDYQSPIGTISGIAKGNGANALTAATAGTDYLAPAAIGTTVQAFDAQLFSNIPQNSQSAAYTLVAGDAQKHIYHPSADTTARTWTIPANSSVAYAVGTAITFVNDTSGGVITIAINTDTLVLAGLGSTGSRTLTSNGIATAIKVASTRWVISGTGLN